MPMAVASMDGFGPNVNVPRLMKICDAALSSVQNRTINKERVWLWRTWS